MSLLLRTFERSSSRSPSHTSYDQGVMSALLSAGQVCNLLTFPSLLQCRSLIIFVILQFTKVFPQVQQDATLQSFLVAIYVSARVAVSCLISMNPCSPPGNRLLGRCLVESMGRRLARTEKDNRFGRYHYDHRGDTPSSFIRLRSDGCRTNHHRPRKRSQCESVRRASRRAISKPPLALLQTSTVPSYHAECSPAAHRGSLIMIEGSLITFGIMIS